MAERGVSIPRDPEKRRHLADMAGLTDEERLALDEWCAEQQREDDRRQRRGAEAVEEVRSDG